MARPKIVWGDEQFRQLEELCRMCATQDEIEAVMGHDIDTISRLCREHYHLRGFSDVYKKYSAAGKVSLRRTQLKLAEKSAAMAIFLGRNLLGQKNVDADDSVDDGEIAAVLDKIKGG